MNNQQAFDIMVNHLRKQGKQSRIEGMTTCAYRGADGLKCAIGALIPDEIYSERMENVNVYTLWKESEKKFPKISELFANINLELLSEMQDIHDFNEPNQWERRFELCAAEYNLDYKTPERLQ